MKKIKLFLLLPLLVVCFISCSKDDDKGEETKSTVYTAKSIEGLWRVSGSTKIVEVNNAIIKKMVEDDLDTPTGNESGTVNMYKFDGVKSLTEGFDDGKGALSAIDQTNSDYEVVDNGLFVISKNGVKYTYGLINVVDNSQLKLYFDLTSIYTKEKLTELMKTANITAIDVNTIKVTKVAYTWNFSKK